MHCQEITQSKPLLAVESDLQKFNFATDTEQEVSWKWWLNFSSSSFPIFNFDVNLIFPLQIYLSQIAREFTVVKRGLWIWIQVDLTCQKSPNLSARLPGQVCNKHLVYLPEIYNLLLKILELFFSFQYRRSMEIYLLTCSIICRPRATFFWW